jgi:hypothetical protein
MPFASKAFQRAGNTVFDFSSASASGSAEVEVGGSGSGSGETNIVGIVTARNELAVYQSLQSACQAKLDSFSTTIDHDRAFLEEHSSAQVQEQQLGEETELGGVPPSTRPGWYRKLCALHVRVGDKLVLQDTISTLEGMKERMPSAIK